MRRLFLVCIALCRAVAWAEDAEGAELVAVDAGVEVTTADAGVQSPPALPVATPAEVVTPRTARQRRAGSVGVGFLPAGQVMRAMPTFSFDPTTGQTTIEQRITVPVLGFRWWTKNPVVGFELGFGLMYSEGKVEQSAGGNPTQGDQPSTLEWLGHIGLPLSVASLEHLIVFVSPEFRVGNSNRTVPATRPDPNFAWTIDAGLRAGVEIFFGFIGLDRLSLEVGARIGVAHEVRMITAQVALGQPLESTTTTTRFSTSLMGDPWAILSGAFALRYYF